MGYYDAIAQSYPALHHEEQLRKLSLIAPFVEKSAAILDVGCGAGVSLVLGNVIGIDPSIGLLKQCPYPCAQGVAEHLPFRDESFEAVICLTACHHFSDMDLALFEMGRVSKGAIIISVLKKSKNFAACIDSIHSHFLVKEEIDDLHDFILICAKKQRL